ncbi:FMN-dependent NADH-azoreductase [Pseudoalteromonas denitrificans]|uniref:FMN dependent NADH:quinone oxidoreductase n=1 Tax=Pseudoalteromonas denitrificans DSM 6059 TaxID=1123010 RepID=A0A1I1NNI4_9GAMM|nr:NAD(P)H-dependent oxidoreductase [Pseudoalteromonas denitrificans]SFC99077.1 FMN-dependent NADH-azoreductase [Pseudoalteromonas denitrificans DSM 6059]
MVKNVLIIKSSPAGEASISNQVANYLMATMCDSDNKYQFTIRNLANTPAPVYNSEILGSFYGDPHALTAHQVEIAKPSLEYIDELKKADMIVLASPMHNFGITSLLKNYLDQICRFGLTFQYGTNGPEGLLTNKQAIIIASAGGDFSSAESKVADFQTPYLKKVLSFIGLDEVQVITAYGVAQGKEGPLQAQKHAQQQIQKLMNTYVA